MSNEKLTAMSEEELMVLYTWLGDERRRMGENVMRVEPNSPVCWGVSELLAAHDALIERVGDRILALRAAR